MYRKREIVSLLVCACSLVVGAQQAPMQVRFNSPGTLRGSQPWYSGKPAGYQGKVSVGFRPASQVDPDWENSSLPIGNGSIGASVFGAIETERIALNEKSLWLGGPNTTGGAAYYWNVNKRGVEVLQQIRQAFLDGNDRLAGELTSHNMNGVASYEPSDEQPWRFGTYTTMGELQVATGVSADGISDYSRVLSLDSAFTRVSFVRQGVRYIRESFCSYPDNVLVMRYRASKRGRQNLSLTYLANPPGHRNE